MAFSFGSSTPAPAPAGGGFSFGGGSSTPAAAPATGGFSFGGSTPAPAPATGGGLFGNTPTLAPAPAAGNFSFGGGAPSTPAPAPSTGFSFGSPAAAPAPSGSSLFGTPAPAPASGGLFGSTPTSSYGQPQYQQQQQGQQQQQQQGQITATTPFKSLPPNAQKLVDDIHNLIHQHNQTMSSVSTMIPALLTEDADRAAGTSSSSSSTMNVPSIAPLSQRMQATHNKLAELKEELDDTSISVSQVFEKSNDLYALTHQCAIYPVQNIAARRNIDLPFLHSTSSSSSSTSEGEKNLSETVKRLNAMLQENATQVDRLEGMPSVYLWRTMEDLQMRIEGLYQKLAVMKKELDGRRTLVWREVERVSGAGGGAGGGSGNMDATEEVSLAMQNQMHSLVRVAGVVGKLNENMDELRQAYKRQLAKERFQKGGMSSGNAQMNMGMSRGMNMNMGMGGIDVGSGIDVGIGMDRGAGFDPFLDADRREQEEERRLNMEVRKRTIQASANIPMMNAPPVNTLAPAPAAGGLFGSTPAPAGGGLFGSTPAPASGGFGGSTPAPAGGGFGGFGSPAPAGGGLFGSTPAPAGGGLFGGTPAPAPAGGGLFGSTPAPAPTGGGLFGASSPTAAPAAGNFSFGGSTPAPATGGGLFGGTPAPAPAAGGYSFGGTAAPAPAAGGLFGAPAAPAPAASKTRRRAGRRR